MGFLVGLMVLFTSFAHANEAPFAEASNDATAPAVFEFRLMKDASHNLAYYFPQSLDLDDKLPAATAKTLRALPTPVENHATARDKALIADLLKGVGLDVSQTLFVKVSGSADVVTIPLAQVETIGLTWGDEKRVAVVHFEIPVKGSKSATALGFVGKENPFKSGLLNAVDFKTAAADPVSLISCDYLRMLFPGEGAVRGKKAPAKKSCKTEAAAFGDAKIFHLTFAHSAKHADDAAYAYYIRAKADAWLSGRVLGGENMNKDPGGLFAGDVVKGYDAILLMGAQDGNDCGHITFLKQGVVTQAPLVCRLSDN